MVTVLDSRTGYDLLNGAGHEGAIDIAAMKQALLEDGASRLVRRVPGNDHIADDLAELTGNGKLMLSISDIEWSLRDTKAKALREDAAERKRKYRQRIAERRVEAEQLRQRG